MLRKPLGGGWRDMVAEERASRKERQCHVVVALGRREFVWRSVGLEVGRSLGVPKEGVSRSA